MSVDLAKLIVRLEADSAKLMAELERANRKLDWFGKSTDRLTKGIASRLGGMFTGLSVAYFAKSVVDAGDRMDEFSERTGLAVEKLSAYNFGAKQSGVETEALVVALQKLGLSMEEALVNPSSEAAQVFKALDMDISKLGSRSAVFEELARQFNATADGEEKVAIARKLMGKTGDALIPMMNNLQETSARAKELGVVMSDGFAKSAGVFNDNIDEMWAKLTSFAQKALAPTLDMLNRLYDQGTAKSQAAQLERSLGIQAEMARLQKEGMSAAHPQMVALQRQVDELNKKVLATSANMNTLTGGKGKLPSVADKGTSDRALNLMADLEKATSTAQMSIVDDEARKAEMRMRISEEEWKHKIDMAKLGAAERQKVEEAYLAWYGAAMREMEYASRTPVKKLLDEWENTTKQMQNATATWLQSGADSLTEFVMTGKMKFSDFASAIIRDLVKIQIQKMLAGFAGWLGFGGGKAEGGPVEAGKSYIVGESGPEMVTFGASGYVTPNSQLAAEGGGVYNIDARGADREGLARLEAMILRLNGSIEHRAVSAVHESRMRGGSAGMEMRA